jgi:hypothetical protein
MQTSKKEIEGLEADIEATEAAIKKPKPTSFSGLTSFLKTQPGQQCGARGNLNLKELAIEEQYPKVRSECCTGYTEALRLFMRVVL